MAESKIAPGELLKGTPLQNIKELIRKPDDKFWVFATDSYVRAVRMGIARATIHRNYKTYLVDLVDYVDKHPKIPKKTLETIFSVTNKSVDVAEVTKYFGEIIGALHIARSQRASHIVFPQRSNYELFDYFVRIGGKHHGYSAKAEGGSSNTLAPRLIAERVEAFKKGAHKDLGISVIMQLANEPTYKGAVQAVGMLAKQNIFPKTMSSDSVLKQQFKNVRWEQDALVIEANKDKPIVSLGLSGQTAYLSFLVNHVVPRMKTAAGSPSKFTPTNLVYGFIAMYLADVSKEGAFDLTPTIRKLFTDLNIVKMRIDKGVPAFHVIAKGRVEEVTLRSKARWTIIKDKLGVQL